MIAKASLARLLRVGLLVLIAMLLSGLSGERCEARVEQLPAAGGQNSSADYVQSVFAEAEALRAKGDLDSLQRAINKYSEAQSLYETLSNRDGEANALSKLGAVRFETGEISEALDDWNQELSLRRATGNRRGEAAALHNIGLIYNDRGQKQKALDYFNQSLILYRSLGSRVTDPNVLIDVGWVYYSLLELKKALDNFNQALSLSRTLGNREAEARALLGIGGTYTHMGENQKALDFDNRALVINRAMGARREEAYNLFALAWLSVGLGDKPKALDQNQASLALMREIGERKGEAMVLHGIGWVYDLSGEKQKAVDYYSQALPLRQAAGDRIGEADTLYRLAQCERDRGSLGEALAHIDATIKIIDSLRAEIGNRELRVNYIAFAQDYYDFYIELLVQLHQSSPSQGYDASALQISERARARSLIELLSEAGADIRQGVDATLLERERTLQQVMTAATTRRVRLLNLRHTTAQANQATQELETLTSAYQDVESKIRAASPRYAALTQPQPLTLAEIQQLLDADTLLLEFALGKSHSYLWAVTPTSITTFELEKGSAVRDAARRVYRLLTARTTKLPRETVPQRDVRIRKADVEYQTAAATLGRMLLAPVSSQLGHKRLVIVSDGALQYIPFAALPIPREGKEEERGRETDRSALADPLILEHEVVNLPSASTLKLLRDDLAGRRPHQKTIAVFADPVFEATDARVTQRSNSTRNASRRPSGTSTSMGDEHSTRKVMSDYLRHVRMIAEGQPLARLPYSRKEALTIAALAPAGQKILLDFDVNYQEATSAELGEYRFVHFATHGLLDTEYPELSGILLSLVDKEGKPQENGILRLGDVYNLRMPVDMVSLSGCETGLGKSIRGEGLIGLTRGFMYAGATRVMASLWKVEEGATAEMMKAFYEGVFGKDQLRPVAALRRAQIAMWSKPDRRAPYYWSAFLIQGEWN